MNFFAISSLLIVITCSISSVFLFKESKRNIAILVWGFVTVLATIWGIGAVIFSTTTDYNTALKGWQIGAIASILAPMVHHHFVLAYLNAIRKKTLYLLYTYGLIAVIYELLYPHYFFGRLEYIFNEFYFISFFQLNNLPYFVHYILAHNVLLLYSFILLIKAYKKSEKNAQNRHKYMILGSGIGWIGTHGDFLTSIIHSYYPYTNILLAIFPLVITYAIIRHQLLDIKIVIKKSLVYTILITCLTILYFGLAYLTERLFQNMLGYKSLLVSLCLATFIAIIFIPLKNFIQTMIDHLFFKGTTIEIAEENERLRDEAAQKEKFKAVATLASSLAHDIRNPITTLKAFVEHAPSKMNDPQFMEKFKDITKKEFGRIESLLNNLLDYSKPSPPELSNVDVHKILDETLDLLSGDLIKHNVKIEKIFATKMMSLSADKNQLKQIFLNLFINALDAMPFGGILRIETGILNKKGQRVKGLEELCHPESAEGETKDLKRDSSLPAFGDVAQNDGTPSAPLTLNPSTPLTLQITISDTGCGIAPEDIKHIFDPFFTKKDGGTGLGLSIVKGIIENHGGKIICGSVIGQGTTFAITMPLKPS